ncbi:MAG: 3-hydroxyacyl-CoA dehydrogenase NAD-binding protein [Thermomicrobiales bacterium]|nr:3-hydroxyacyl-CoA dehydrogenase NAD-binding protein [Thermomicrobiales bacterium]
MGGETVEGEDGGRVLNTAAIIGAGTMGRQIASLIAGSGRPVRIWDADPGMLAAARERIAAETRTLPDLPRYAHHQFRLEPPTDLDALIERIVLAESLADAVAGADIVIEAVREDLDTKLALFAELSRLAPEAILTTNSSSLPSSQIAPAVDDPGRFLNTHFFAPVWSRPMVELMGSGATRPEVMEAAERFGKSLGLPADVDRLWMLFFGTPYGPFGIMDMVGLDVVADIETSYQRVATDPADQPSAILHENLKEGALGEKTGRGFYSHPDPEYTRAGWLTCEEAHDGQ